MLVYALVDHSCRDAVDLYLDRADAEQDLADALGDEPAWRDGLAVVELEFGVTSAN
jgi:hypothetical protein